MAFTSRGRLAYGGARVNRWSETFLKAADSVRSLHGPQRQQFSTAPIISAVYVFARLGERVFRMYALTAIKLRCTSEQDSVCS